MEKKSITALLSIFIFIGCQSKRNIVTLTLSDSIDTLYLTDFTDTRELHNLLQINDSTIVGYSYHSGFKCTYTKRNKTYSLKHKLPITNAYDYKVYFIDSSGRDNFLGRDNIWYRLNESQHLQKITSIKLELKHLQERFQLIQTHERPIIQTDSTITVSYSEQSPYDYQSYMYESSFANIHLKNDSIVSIDYLFKKPIGLSNDFLVYPIFCGVKSKMFVVYPCIDTVYEYDFTNKKYSTHYIGNKSYSPSEKYNFAKWNEPDYRTQLNLTNFSYRGFFYNPATKHFILYYQMPVSKKIKVPTFEDQKCYALVLDTGFNQIKTVEFVGSFRSPASFFPTSKGIYMPLFIKNQKNENQVTFYLFDL